MSSSHWAKIETPVAVNLKGVISEETAREKQKVLQPFACNYEPQEYELTGHYVYENDLETPEIEDEIDCQIWDRINTLKKELDALPTYGYDMVADHGNRYRIANSKVTCNCINLKVLSKNGKKIRSKKKKKNGAAINFCMSDLTKLLLHEMIDTQLLEKINGVINIGNEAIILHADSGHLFLPQKFAIKVFFRTNLPDFKQIKYGELELCHSASKTPLFWASKENHNLKKMKKAGILCPEVVKHKTHLLVMPFIGENGCPAPTLKDAVMEIADYIVAYNQIIDAMHKLHKKANLVHGNLSEYNILWYNNQCYIIDVSHSVDITHKDAIYLLMRDCSSITDFFIEKSAPGIATSDELFRSIVGFDFTDRVTFAEWQNLCGNKSDKEKHLKGEAKYMEENDDKEFYLTIMKKLKVKK